MKTTRTAPATVAAYLAGLPPAARRALACVRRIVRKAIPNGNEVISYQIPTYKLNGRPVLYFAAFKEHYSLYPSNAAVVAAFKKELTGYELSKGTIRFPLSEPVPERLIERIAKFRAKEVIGAEKAKAATRKKR